MTIVELRQFIVNWIAIALPGTKIIPSDGNGVRPKPPYMTYNFGNKSTNGQMNLIGVSDTGIATYKQHKDITVTINGYGAECEELLDTLSNSLMLNSVREFFFQNCVGYKGVALTVTDISILVDETIEKRFVYEPILGIAQSITEDVGYIETVDSIMEQSTINPPQ